MVSTSFLCLLLAYASGQPWTSYTTALQQLNWTAVDAAITKMLVTAQASWVPDWNHYGPFMVRLAWHCSGSYRVSDGRGGCDGADIRLPPQNLWPDNVQLDKARNLLEGIKAQFGPGLSYGDLYIRTGTIAIQNMGGPVLGFCAGRVDSVQDSEQYANDNLLGPTIAQQQAYPCPAPSNDCQASSGLGPTTIGLIYINPEGPAANPGIPALSAPQIRDTFARMDMNDRETVALIGGGHAFGKTHGACTVAQANATGTFEAPNWLGVCNGSSASPPGQGLNTLSSGFEGPWSQTPFTWSNHYFLNLLNFVWSRTTSPAGHYQFQNSSCPPAPQVTLNGTAPINMLNSDVALTTDANYSALLAMYADPVAGLTTLNTDFSAAWYKLTSRDMGPSKRCFAAGALPVPPSQPFQNDLPAANVAKLPNYALVKADLIALFNSTAYPSVPADTVNGSKYYGALFAQLAVQCGSLYRQTDYRGGCNGARLRFAPENGTADNIALNTSGLIGMLASVVAKYPGLSYADAIALAGHAAVEKAGGFQMNFCAGRVDAADGSGSNNLTPLNWTNTSAAFYEQMFRWNFTYAEAVAFRAVPRTNARGSWQSSASPNSFGPSFFSALTGSCTTNMNAYDLVVRNDPALLPIAQSFVTNVNAFRANFTSAWYKLLTNDFFIGWNNLTCPLVVPAQAQGTSYSSAFHVSAFGMASFIALALSC